MIWTTEMSDVHGNMYHGSFFEHPEDKGGMAAAVAIQIPEFSQEEITEALKTACEISCRVLFLCDTPEQAETMARLMFELIPAYNRVSVERVTEGLWGRRSLM